MSEEKQHKRRVHYSGKYPKKFEEKYKELNPEKYKDTIEHVISKGNTPAGMHISIMVKEIIDFLDIKPGQTGLDATLGYGGHTRAMLEKLEGQGHMFATDVDPIESEKTKKRLAEAGFGEDILTIKLQNFCTIDEIAKEVGGFDFILADLGVSSMQIDNPERGFSFKVDGPLDLRLNPNAGISAAERLDNISREELSGMLYENSDEPYCEELAKAITDEAVKTANYDSIDAAAEDGTAFVFMGHGTSHTAKISYSQMQAQMEQLGYKNVFIGTVEGEPEDTSCESVIAKVKDAGYKNVILRPLMVVAGDHANNDMAGDDNDSWKSQFEASKNFDSVKTQIAGLGEIDAIQQLYVAHTKAAMDAQ